MSDEELLDLVNDNNEDALEELIERYKVTINGVLSKYKSEANSLGLDIKDLYQEGLIGLFKAIKNYDLYKEANFKTYANLLINREMLDLIKSSKRYKHYTLNSAISLDSLLDEADNRSLYDKIESDELTPITKLINEEDDVTLKNLLTDFELKVYELKLEGKSNKEIALILDKNTRSIENTLQRIKVKFKSISD